MAERNRPPIVEKPPQSSIPSLSEQLTSLLSSQEQTRQKELWRDEVEIKIQTRGLPFMLMPLSDIHLAASGVDYQSLQKYLRFLKDYPVYTVLVGDLADNFSPVSHPSAIREDLISPTDQWSLVRAFFKEYQDKILANISGNHDEWTGKAGIDIFRWMAEDLNIPLLKGGGLLRLKVDEQEYKVRLWHRIARLNSQFNLNHSQLQALRLTGDDADMVISADKHLGSLQETNLGKRKVVVCQLGTFKVEDSYGRSQGFIQPPLLFYPVFFFFPNRHNIEAIRDLDTAEELIDGMKKYYKQKAVALLGYGKK